MAHDKGKVAPLCGSSRMGLSFLIFLGFINLYSLRVNLSVAMVCMVNHTALHQGELEANQTNATWRLEDEKCARFLASNSTSPTALDGEFAWPKDVQGLLLGSFFWGYLVTQLPGGWLAARLGGKHVLGTGMLITAIATLLVPLAARFSYIMLLALRILIGLGEGVVWPAMNAMWAYWAPPLERSKLAGFANAGAQIGNVLTLPVAALLCQYGFAGGWPSVFYVLGSVCMVWYIAWLLFVSDTPEQHRRISAAERSYIQNSLRGQTKHTMDTKMSVPWCSILTSYPVWALQITHVCGAWGVYMFLTSIPTYMKEVLRLNIRANGFYSAIPYVGFWLMINVSGFSADLLRSRGILSTTGARKLFNSLGGLVPAGVCVGLGFVDCTRPVLSIALLTLGVSFFGCQYGAGFVVNHVDLAPKYSAVLFGITNTVACVPGFLAPYAVGMITTHHSQLEWQVVFYLTAGILIVGTLVFLVGGSGSVQPWAREPDDLLSQHINGKPRDVTVEFTTTV